MEEYKKKIKGKTKLDIINVFYSKIDVLTKG